MKYKITTNKATIVIAKQTDLLAAENAKSEWQKMKSITEDKTLSSRGRRSVKKEENLQNIHYYILFSIRECDRKRGMKSR